MKRLMLTVIALLALFSFIRAFTGQTSLEAGSRGDLPETAQFKNAF